MILHRVRLCRGLCVMSHYDYGQQYEYDGVGIEVEAPPVPAPSFAQSAAAGLASPQPAHIANSGSGGVAVGGLMTVRGAVEALSHDELMSIASDIRALALSDAAGTRQLLLQNPTLTTALLMIEERLGMLHTLPMTALRERSGGSGIDSTSTAGVSASAAATGSLSTADAADATVTAAPPADALGLGSMSADDAAALLRVVLDMTAAQIAATDDAEQQATIRAVQDAARLSPAEIEALGPSRKSELTTLRTQLASYGVLTLH